MRLEYIHKAAYHHDEYNTVYLKKAAENKRQTRQ